MKALILDGSAEDDTQLSTINSRLVLKLENRGWDVESIPLREEKIATCIGCFGCWLKTPGECILNDNGREIAEKVIQSDLLVFLTPITFGGYSYQLKKMVDRLIPNILPFFTKVDGEIHHQPRYEKYPDILAIGYLPQADAVSEEIFNKLIKRNAINFMCNQNKVTTFIGDVNSSNIDLTLESILQNWIKVFQVQGNRKVMV